MPGRICHFQPGLDEDCGLRGLEGPAHFHRHTGAGQKKAVRMGRCLLIGLSRYNQHNQGWHGMQKMGCQLDVVFVLG